MRFDKGSKNNNETHLYKNNYPNENFSVSEPASLT